MASSTDQDGEELVARMRVGDQQAFNQVFSLFYQRVTFMVIRMVGDADDAKDVLAEVFVKLWDRRADFPSLAAMRSFLYVSARNKALDFLKTKKRQEASRHGYAYWVDHPEEMSALILDAELMSRLDKEIRALPEKCREIVQLAYYEGLSSEEIARQLGISLQTVWNQKTTAMKKLRAAFLRDGLATGKIFFFFL